MKFWRGIVDKICAFFDEEINDFLIRCSCSDVERGSEEAIIIVDTGGFAIKFDTRLHNSRRDLAGFVQH